MLYSTREKREKVSEKVYDHAMIVKASRERERV